MYILSMPWSINLFTPSSILFVLKLFVVLKNPIYLLSIGIVLLFILFCEAFKEIAICNINRISIGIYGDAPTFKPFFLRRIKSKVKFLPKVFTFPNIMMEPLLKFIPHSLSEMPTFSSNISRQVYIKEIKVRRC